MTYTITCVSFCLNSRKYILSCNPFSARDKYCVHGLLVPGHDPNINTRQTTKQMVHQTNIYRNTFTLHKCISNHPHSHKLTVVKTIIEKVIN